VGGVIARGAASRVDPLPSARPARPLVELVSPAAYRRSGITVRSPRAGSKQKG
jgi:hypothetical protein